MLYFNVIYEVNFGTNFMYNMSYYTLFFLEREKGGREKRMRELGELSLISLKVNRYRIKLKIYMYTDRLSLERER